MNHLFLSHLVLWGGEHITSSQSGDDVFTCRKSTGTENIAIFDLAQGEWNLDSGLKKPGYDGTLENTIFPGYANVPSRLLEPVCEWFDARQPYSAEPIFTQRYLYTYGLDELEDLNSTGMDFKMQQHFWCEMTQYGMEDL